MLRFVATNTSPAFWSPRTENIHPLGDIPPAAGSRTSDAPLIYAVDDMRCLTELYSLVLEAAGYAVRIFNDRAQALAALKAGAEKPDLLITDYRNTSMAVERFMHECLIVHPALRILMASGLTRPYIRLSHVRPDRFIQKPFTPEELLQEVERALADKPAA
jgi:DNA-binding NtrC family response regulator